jgi:hypothetical protein
MKGLLFKADSIIKCLNLLPLCHQSSEMPCFRAKHGGGKVAAGGSKWLNITEFYEG